jgi:hypothetical protein
MLIIPTPPSLIFKQHTFLSIWFGLLFGVDFFLCKSSDIKGLDIASIPKYYQDAIQAWNNFLRSCSTESKNDILETYVSFYLVWFIVPCFSWVRVAQSFVFCEEFHGSLFFLLSFSSIGHYIVNPSLIYGV